MRPTNSKQDDRQLLLRTRRDFIRQAACAAVGTVGMSNALRDFRFINSALAQTGGAFTDYKAMVCIFMSGGNDCNNFIIPRGAGYSNYNAARQILAIPLQAIETGDDPLTPGTVETNAPTSIFPINNDGNEYGFHPSCTELASLFNAGKLATMFNTGPLLYPITRDQYQKKSVSTPPQLFSHSDQVTHWQTSLPDQPPKTGWGGRAADKLHPFQYDLSYVGSTPNQAQIALCTSLAGANTFEVGNDVQQYHVSTSGAVTLSNPYTTGVSNPSATQLAQAANRKTALLGMLGQPNPNLQVGAYGEVMNRAIVSADTLNTAITPTAAANYFTTAFPTTSLGNQLKMVARLIAGRDALKIKRQIFFVSVGGYDTHTSQVGNAANPGNPLFGSHANLLNELSEAIGAFQAGIEQIAGGLYGGGDLVNKVVGFTASDFGRTFPSNGQGSDHGWGSHHIIFGGDGTSTGAVKGKRTYGQFPVLQINGPNDTSTGRWIPTTSVDQYSATLAKWFGINSTNMPYVFPNLGRFAVPDLGFMA